jgi:hypothetical protein
MSLALCVALGVLGPVYALWSLGHGTGVVAASAVGIALPLVGWLGGRRPAVLRRASGLAAQAAGTGLAALVLLPRFGIIASSAAAALVLAVTAAALKKSGAQETDDACVPPAWAIALAAAAIAAWSRALGLLWGDSFTAVWAVAAAMNLALAAGFELRRRYSAGMEEEIPPEFWLLCSGLAGGLGLAWLRMIGLNAGSDELLLTPLGGRGAWLVAIPSVLASSLWLVPLPLASHTRGGWRSALMAGAGPAAAWLLAPRLGPEHTAAAFHVALSAGALACLGRRLASCGPVMSKTAVAMAVLTAALGWRSPCLADVWLNRLNAAWPGGRFLELSDDGRESLGLYRFSSGAPVLLSNGRMWHNGGLSAKRQAHLPMLLSGRTGRVLLVSNRNPATLISALAHGAEIVALDPHPAAESILRAQTNNAWPPAAEGSGGATIRFVHADARRFLASRGESFSTIIMELPSGETTPEAARLTTREAFSLIKSRLTPDGVAAQRLPEPWTSRAAQRVEKTARSVFAHVGTFELPGGRLLVASDGAIAAGLAPAISDAVKTDDPNLAQDWPRLDWREYSGDNAGPPDTDDRLGKTLRQ